MTVFNARIDAHIESEGTNLSTLGHDNVTRWFKEEFPEHSIHHPLQADYCDACAEHKQRKRTLLRVGQHEAESGNSNPQEATDLKLLLDSIKKLIQQH